MRKALIIAQKDTLISLYDKTGFAFLVITPLIITIIMGAVFGGGDDNQGNFRIPVAIVQQDSGTDLNSLAPETANNLQGGVLDLGQIMIDILTSEGLSDILDANIVDDEQMAKELTLSEQKYCCVVIIPPGFSQSLLAGQEAKDITIYSDPARDVSAQIVKTIVRQIASQLASNSDLFEISRQLLLDSGRISPPGYEEVSTIFEAQFQSNPDTGQLKAQESLVSLETRNASGDEVEFNILSFFAPSMAIIFLAFGASQGARTLLTEEQIGTFDRLNATPTSANSILLGKLLGTFLSGAIQFSILIILSTLLFGLQWGDPLAVLVLSIFIILGFTSLGLVMAVIARDENQSNTISTTVLVVFMVLGGNLAPASNFPSWLENIAQITPNYWGVQGFIKLGQSQTLSDLSPEIIALSLMSIILFALGSVLYKRRVTI